MSLDPLDALLGKLAGGDDAAAEQMFRAFEPYLRMIVRRQLSQRLRSKFDSIDIVQSVWADVVEGFRDRDWNFADAGRLRAFLIKMTRNRFLDRVRHHEYILEHETTSLETTDVEPESPEPQASEVVRAEELWEQIMSLCPPAHREVLLLKRQGVALAEIAARTGMHEGSIRRILYDVARRLALQRTKDGSAPESLE